MMELTINGQVYQFNFGMGFLREADTLYPNILCWSRRDAHNI